MIARNWQMHTNFNNRVPYVNVEKPRKMRLNIKKKTKTT